MVGALVLAAIGARYVTPESTIPAVEGTEPHTAHDVSPGAPQAPSAASGPPVEMIQRPAGAYQKSPTHGKHGPKKRRTLREIQTGAGQEIPAAQMAAAGISKTRIAEALGISKSAAETILARPHVQEYVQQVREATRHITLSTVQNAQIQVGDWLRETIASRDPRAFDSITRGMHALEKTSASASGETRPGNTQVAVINAGTLTEEAQALIRALIPEPVE